MDKKKYTKEEIITIILNDEYDEILEKEDKELNKQIDEILNTLNEKFSCLQISEKAGEFFASIVKPDKMGVIVKFKKGENILEQKLLAKAAGEAQNLPPDIPFPKDLFVNSESISISLEPDAIHDCVNLQFIGGSYETRCLIKIEILYEQKEKDIFSGKEIAKGGAWTISWEKARQIHSINVSIGEDK